MINITLKIDQKTDQINICVFYLDYFAWNSKSDISYLNNCHGKSDPLECE